MDFGTIISLAKKSHSGNRSHVGLLRLISHNENTTITLSYYEVPQLSQITKYCNLSTTITRTINNV